MAKATMNKLNIHDLRVLRDLCENRWLLHTKYETYGSTLAIVDYDTGKQVVRPEYDTGYEHFKKYSKIRFRDLNLLFEVKQDSLPFIDTPEERTMFSKYHYLPRKETREWWVNEGKAKLASLEAKEADARAAVERLVVVSGKDGIGSTLTNRRYAYLARVVRETGKRIYVEVVKPASKVDPEARVSEYCSFDGYKPNLYVSAKAEITVDPATEVQFNRLVRTESEVIADRVRVDGEMRAEIEEIRERYRRRAVQQSAMHEQMLREAKGDD